MVEFNFATPQQPETALTKSAFSFNFAPETVAAYSANPNANIAGGVNPTGQQNLTFQNQSSSNTQNTSATDVTSIKPQTYNPNVGINNPSQNNQSSSPINSNALSLLSSAGKSVLPGVTSSINNFGMGLGFGSGGGAAEAISPALAAADPSLVASGASVSSGAASAGSLTGASLSGVLGAAGLGALGGGILAHALGENSTGGSIGGAIGAGIGMALFGPLGAVGGGALGSVVGGLFGNNTAPTSAAEGAYTLSPDGSVKLSGQGAKNAGSYSGYPSSIATALNSQFSNAEKTMGITFDKTDFRAGVNTKYSPSGQPGYIEVGGKEFGFAPGNMQSQTDAVNQAVIYMAQKNGATPEQIANYNNSSQSNLQAMAPSLPNNPKGNEEQSSWNNFLNNFKAQQNANAAPTPTA